MGAHRHDSPPGPAGGRLGADLAAHVESIVRAAEREARNAEQAIAARRRSAEEEARRYLAASRLEVEAEAAARAARVETLSAAARRLADELGDAVSALRRELEREPDAAHLAPPWPRTDEHPAPSGAAAPGDAEAEPAEQAAERVRETPPEQSRSPRATWARAPQASPGEHAADRGHAAEPAATTVTEPAGERAVRASDEAATDGEAAVPSAARLVAIEMAVGGSSRAEVDEHLRTRLAVEDPAPLLDDVFGAASHAGSRLAWGEP